MATQTNFSLRKGRTGTIVVTVTGVTDWTGLQARLFAASELGVTPEITLTGSIDTGENKIALPYTHETTDDLTLSKYYYEIVVYKTDKTYVKDTNYGIITITDTVKNDPTE